MIILKVSGPPTWYRNTSPWLVSVTLEHCEPYSECVHCVRDSESQALIWKQARLYQIYNIFGEWSWNHSRQGQDPGIRSSKSFIISIVLITQVISFPPTGLLTWLNPGRLHLYRNTKIFARRVWLAWNQRLDCFCLACHAPSGQAEILLDVAFVLYQICWVWQ